MSIISKHNHTEWKPLGTLSPFLNFTLPDNYKELFPKYTFHYECIEFDLDECDYTYLEIDGYPIILQKYLNLEKNWWAEVNLFIQTPELIENFVTQLKKEFNIEEIQWFREDFFSKDEIVK